MTLHELIERLEKAEGPDRKLDDQIAATGWKFTDHVFSRDYRLNPETNRWELEIPHFTSSLDTALTLPDDPDLRGELLVMVAKRLRAAKLDPALYAARLFCLYALRAQEGE